MITLKETSWSSLDLFRKCARKWWYHYISDIQPAFTPVALAFGSGIHSGCQAYYKGLAEGRELRPKNLVRVLENILENDSIQYNGKSKDEHIQMSEKMFEQLCSLPKPNKILGVEQNMEYEVSSDFRIISKIDLLTEDSTGQTIIDFKTAAKRMNGDADSHGQVSVYSLSNPSARLKFVVFLKTQKGGIEEIETKRNDSQRKQIVQDFLDFKRQVESDDCTFIRNPSYLCYSCQYKDHCEGRNQ
ncbi:MAG: PD-(D/E)XK nuclease family protein [bacterium]